MKPQIRLYCLGDFKVDGLPRPLSGRKQTALLAFLATNLGSPCSRSKLASIFWGDRFDDQARQSLRQALSSLRKAFGTRSDCLQIKRETVCLDASWVSVDTKDAETAMANGNLEQAATLFRRGSLLESMTSRETGFSDWLVIERAKWGEMARQAVLGRGEQLLDKGQPVAAEEMATWLLRLHPYDEPTLRLVMRAKAKSGSTSGAIKLYRQFENTLKDELGVVPARETMDCLEHLMRADGGRRESAMPQISSGAPRTRVIILPFTDIHAGPEGSTMADCLTDEVIAALGRFLEMAVTGRNTSFAYRDMSRDLPDLVRDLDIQYVVSGTVRRLGNRLRINVELDDAVAQRFVSSEKLDCPVEEFYDVQENLARAIAGAIEPELTSDTTRKFAQRPMGSLALWEKALVARGHLERGSKESLLAAEALAIEILEKDQDHLQALKVLATIRYALVWNLWPDDLMAMAKSALEISEKVLKMDPFDSDTLSIAARNYLTLRHFDKALELAEHSVELNPSNAQSQIHLGACYSNLGRFDEAFDCFREARRLSPRDRLVAFWDCAESYAHYGQGSIEDAVRISGASAKKPGTWAWTRIVLAIALVKQKRADDARRQAEILRTEYPTLTCERIRPLLMPQFEYDMINCLKAAGVPEK